MKKVLFYTLIVVVAATLLTWESSLSRRTVSTFADAAGEVDVLVFSTGTGHDEFLYLPGQTNVSGSIMVEDLVLTTSSVRHGIWVACFDPGFELVDHEQFDLAGDPTAAGKLARHLAERPLDTTAVLLINGTIQSEVESGLEDYSPQLAELALHRDYFDPGLKTYQQLFGGQGWLAPESGSRDGDTQAWTSAVAAELALWIPEPDAGHLDIRAYSIKDDHEPRHLTFTVNGTKLPAIPMPTRMTELSVPVPEGVLHKGLNAVTLSTERLISPFQASGSSDTRQLGVLVDFIRFRPRSSSQQAFNQDPHPENSEALGGRLDPGRKSDRKHLDADQWFRPEKSRRGYSYAWSRVDSAVCRLNVLDPGPGELVVVGYGVPDQQGPRTLSVLVDNQVLGTVELPGRMTEMRFTVPADLGSQEWLNLTLALDRLTPAPGNDSRMLGILVDEVRFERRSTPVNLAPHTLWLHPDRAIVLPGTNLAGNTLHIGWTRPTSVPVDLEITITDLVKGRVLHTFTVQAGDAFSHSLELPEGIPTSAWLTLSLSSREPSAGLAMTKLLVEHVSGDALTELFTMLGARARPWLDEQASWTMVTTKRPGGWVPLAESYSLTTGVMSAVTVLPDRSLDDDYRGEFWRHESADSQ